MAFTSPRRVQAIADLFANVWQLGYVTTDLDRATEEIAGRFALEHCLEVLTAEATSRSLSALSAESHRRAVS